MGFTLGTKFNENTDWEFTVSNETIKEIVESDTVTEQDIAPYCFTALIDTRVAAMVAESVRNTNDGLYPWALSYCAAYNANSGTHPAKVVMNKNALDENKVTVYERNILTYYGTIGNKTGHFLVMDVKNIKKWIVDYDTYPIYTSGNVSSTNGFNGYSGGVYIYSDTNVARVSPYQAPANPAPTSSIFLFNIMTMNDVLWVGSLNPSAHSKEKLANQHMPHQAWDTAWAAGDVFNTAQTNYIYQGTTPTMQGWCNFPDFEFPDPSGYTTTFECYIECDDETHSIIKVSGQYGNSQNQYVTDCEQGHIVKTHDDALTVESWCGLLFRDNNTIYKPIIEQGVIVGYTDDMTKTSEFDDMTNVTGNNISPTPPAPLPPDAHDNEIDVNMGQFAPTQCFVNYIEMSTENMIKLASGFNAYNASIWNIGGDLMKNLISYKIFAAYGTHSGTIKNVSIGGHEIEYESAPISGNYIDDMGTIDLGTIEIGSKFKFNDWRDYAPYTKIECFVPCCGWALLPPWCMGRTITGTLYIDIANGSCKAVIKAGKTPVAEIGGCVAMDVPFSSVATGAKAAGIITAITNGAAAAFNPTPQNLISGGFGILSSLNANHTESKGVMGDGSNINGCKDFLIKVTRPASTDNAKGTMTNAYKHERGLPCGKSMSLSKGDGFTQIMDANITGTMTAREKQMIVDGFRHGLIL